MNWHQSSEKYIKPSGGATTNFFVHLPANISRHGVCGIKSINKGMYGKKIQGALRVML